MGYDRNDCWMTHGELEDKCVEMRLMNGPFPKDPFAEIERLRAALKPFADFDPYGWSGPMLKGFNRSGQEALIKRSHFDNARDAY